MTTADLNRRIESLIRLGTLAQVDHNARRVRVQSGGLLTGWLPWPADVGRNYRHWRPLRLGTQVVLGCPSGDPAQAVILQILYTDALNAPSTDPNADLILFDDGSRLEHNATTGQITLHAKGNLDLTADGNIKINGKRVDIN